MMEPPPPEFTVICIDNGRRAVYCKAVYRAQVKAARLYCNTVLQCNPKNIVSIITMSSLGFGELVLPTSDLEQIMSALRYVPCQGEGETEVQRALACAWSTFSSAPLDMKKRLLMFVGSTINLHLSSAFSYGEMLKENGVAVNVFNFFRLKIDPLFNCNASVLQGTYRYGRTELDTLVTTVNDDGNSHIVDITENYESSALDTLSKTTLKEHLHYLEMKAAADDKNVEASKIHFVKPELERFHNGKNKSVTDDDEYGQATVIGYGNVSKKKAEKNVNVENQNSAADDECVQAPGMECLSKKTPRLSKKKKKKTKENVNVYTKDSPIVTNLKAGENEKVKLEAA